MPRKKKTAPAASPVRIVDPPEPEDDVEPTPEPEAEPASPARAISPDLDMASIYDRITSLKGVEENITDVRRVLGDLETEFATVKADYSKRVKTVKAVLDDNIAALERLTHSEVFDRARGQVYLVHNSQVRAAEDLIRTIAETDDEDERADWIAQLDRLAKTTRALELDDSQEALPFAAEG
jgi:hypothetical protein